MLIGIPPILSPEIVATLMRMGHGDEIVLADANFPADSVARQTVTGELLRLDAVVIPPLLSAVLTLMPLDYAQIPVFGMAAPPELGKQPIHAAFEAALDERGYAPDRIEYLPRFDFYERAKKAYAVIATGETARFANVILKKGVVIVPSPPAHTDT